MKTKKKQWDVCVGVRNKLTGKIIYKSLRGYYSDPYIRAKRWCKRYHFDDEHVEIVWLDD